MTTATTNSSYTSTHVGMSQIAVVTRNMIARAVLGSCIGLVLFEPTRRVAGVAHILLPKSRGTPQHPGKFVDTAIPEILRQLRRYGVCKANTVALVVGGASLFAKKGPIQIGQQNQESVLKFLDNYNIDVAAKDIGGEKGRKISFDPQAGILTVEKAGERAYELSC